jgi:hypothetical protein
VTHATIRIAATIAVGGFFVTQSCGAIAQTTTHSSAKAEAGKPSRIGYYAIFKKDCSPGPIPEVRVTEPPKHGHLIVQKAKVRTNRVANCPGAEGPAHVVFYRARPDYTGEDTVTYEVTKPSGETQAFSVRITVDPAKPSSPSANETQKL